MIDSYDERFDLIKEVSDETLSELIQICLHKTGSPILSSKEDLEKLVQGQIITKNFGFDPCFVADLKLKVYSKNGIIDAGHSEQGASDFWHGSTDSMRYDMLKSILIHHSIIFTNPIHDLDSSALRRGISSSIERAKIDGAVSVPKFPHSYFRSLNEPFPNPEPRPDLLAMSLTLVDFLIYKVLSSE